MSDILLNTINSEKRQQNVNSVIESRYLKAVDLFKQSELSSCEQEKQQFDTLACQLLQQDAELGHTDAQYAYAQCLRFGIGIEKNQQHGIEWLERAVEQKHLEAQFELAMLLPLEHEQHLTLLQNAAKQGHIQSILCMAVHEQRKQNYANALHWLTIAKELGVPRAYYLLAQMYRLGHGVERDLVEVVLLLEKAAELGDVDAYFELFQAYKNGYGTKKNSSKALHYLSLARNHQHLEAASIEY